ncbi:ZYRO0G05478p [Zygosaccharomyces rouxii]|uniref:ZYRO0G05478p n=1 Tax=Zygosaccharomyces rouxii (strain ATCC 2623 / CBS 732 / NBRC 1130 / NCYC 568 / NRRL Y-229) TaxID=559307 RepID=C5DZL8_ZYGRC|nr:uncharacterized protein ZYRO0G05478g [Zygosaccharomyces rouxii]KAH9202300.1 hypothetical protein LQ764DRAFT_5529 [Zygosaccharomyces rouxii]CAR29302.1 ZYRO0G05478p [Zygosaccharomyces rouxii]
MASEKSNNPLTGKEKSTESISNLTRPQLFSLYDEDITKSADSEDYERIRSRGSAGSFSRPASSNSQMEPGPTPAKKRWAPFFRFVFAMVVLSLAGIAYHELSRHLHDNHKLHPELASRPLLVGVQLSQFFTGNMAPDWAVYAFEGIFFGSCIPLIDYIFSIKTRHASWLSILKTVNAMLGVTFGIRKVQWSSSLQAAIAWGLLNIILWLFFDGTISMFITCSTLGLLSCATCYSDITDKSQLLYFVDFYFLGLLLFGELGRYLFSTSF